MQQTNNESITPIRRLTIVDHSLRGKIGYEPVGISRQKKFLQDDEVSVSPTDGTPLTLLAKRITLSLNLEECMNAQCAFFGLYKPCS
jgi:hypothetical protein